MTIPAPTLVRLATMGLAPEHAAMVADMLREVEEATKADAGAQIEARRANDRERKARQRHVTSREVTGRHVTARDTLPPEERKVSRPSKETQPLSQSPPSPPSGALPPPGAKPKRACRIDPAWQPSPETRAYCRNLGFTTKEIEAGAEDLRQWAVGNGAAKVDWEATFKGWMRRNLNGQPRARGSPGGSVIDNDSGDLLSGDYGQRNQQNRSNPRGQPGGHNAMLAVLARHQAEGDDG